VRGESERFEVRAEGVGCGVKREVLRERREVRGEGRGESEI
jgi:hypothetical protein